jgi:hypothetical protein
MKLLKELQDFSYDHEEVKKSLADDNKDKPLIVQGVLQRADALNQNGRIYPRDILEAQLDSYKLLVKERRAIGELDHCLSENAQILTANHGWKYLKDISDKEEVYTLNTETDEIEIEQIKKKIDTKSHSKLMFHITNGKTMDMLVSPNHKVLMWDRYHRPYKVTAIELYDLWKNNDSKLSHSYLRNSGVWKAKKQKEENFTIPGTQYSMPLDVWAALFGIWTAEGHVSGSRGSKGKGYSVGITQKKEFMVKKINELLSKTNIPWRESTRTDQVYGGITHDWKISGKDIHAYFKQFGNSKTKFIPREFLRDWDKETLSMMFDWMLMGDGRNRRDKKSGRLIKEYSTISQQLSEDTTEILFKLGAGSFIKRLYATKDIKIQNRVVKKENLNTLFTTAENITNSHMRCCFVKMEPVQYSGRLYCVSTKNGNFLARDKGRPYWTGNSDSAVVNLKNASHVITEIWMESDGTVKGKVEVLEDLPMGQILKNLFKANIRVGISSRALGSVSRDSGRDADIVQDDLHLVCFDMVSEPSTNGAWMTMTEGREYSQEDLKKIFSRQDRVNRAVSELLNLNKKIKK